MLRFRNIHDHTISQRATFELHFQQRRALIVVIPSTGYSGEHSISSFRQRFQERVGRHLRTEKAFREIF